MQDDRIRDRTLLAAFFDLLSEEVAVEARALRRRRSCRRRSPTYAPTTHHAGHGWSSDHGRR